jgi:pyruvate-ferredoxin/flavodoxin oxidoreductase
MYQAVASTHQRFNIERRVIGGQYGLASKEFTPKHVLAAFENLQNEQGIHNFVVGINDDVSHTSLKIGNELDTVPEGTTQCLFWGLGTDGTVGANKAAIKTIGSNTNLFTQGHFAFDS